MAANHLYLGTKSHLVAIDPLSGATLWKTKLKGGLSGQNFVTLLVHAGRVYAHTGGELFCLDGATGAMLWHNQLAGLGYDFGTLAVEGLASLPSAVAAAHAKKQAGDAAAISATGA